MDDQRYNAIAAASIVSGTFVIIGLLAALMGATAGEVAGAPGSIVGGTVGALGSAAAVYIMPDIQRKEEIEKVSGAVLPISRACSLVDR